MVNAEDEGYQREAVGADHGDASDVSERVEGWKLGQDNGKCPKYGNPLSEGDGIMTSKLVDELHIT